MKQAGFKAFLCLKNFVQLHQISAKSLVTITSQFSLNLLHILCYTIYITEPCSSDTTYVSKLTFTLFLRHYSAESFTHIKQIEEFYTFHLHFPPNLPIIKCKGMCSSFCNTLGKETICNKRHTLPMYWNETTTKTGTHLI